MRHVKRGSVLLLILVSVCSLAWLYRLTLLQTAVDLWTVSDPISPVDAVAVLGGGLETRSIAAADYYKNGLARKVLIANVRVRSDFADVIPSETSLNQGVLLKLGVPEAVIEKFGSQLSNTYQEAVALRDWALSNGIHSLAVPTEYFSSRRVHWMIHREFEGTGIRVQVPALDDPAYPRAEWWKDEKGLLAFQNEILKYFYYRLKY